jgi:hypothetical protein
MTIVHYVKIEQKSEAHEGMKFRVANNIVNCINVYRLFSCFFQPFAYALKLHVLVCTLGLMAQQIRSGTTLGSFTVGTESALGSLTV